MFLWENILLQQQINNQAIYHETRKPLHVADKGSHTQAQQKKKMKSETEIFNIYFLLFHEYFNVCMYGEQ